MGIQGGAVEADPMLLVKMLADPVEFGRRVAEFEAAQTAAEEKIALAGPASQILALRASIDNDVTLAAKALADAKDEAAAIVASARVSAADIISAAQVQAEAVRVQAAESMATAAGWNASASAALSSAAQKKREADDMLKDAEDTIRASAEAQEQAKVDSADAKDAQQAAESLRANLQAAASAFASSLDGLFT